MKKLFLFIIGFGLMLSLNAQDELINKLKNNKSEDTDGFVFTTIIDNDHSSIKNQAWSGTCWSYSTSSFVESEMMRMGKPYIDISEMYTVRKVYEDKGRKYVRLHGKMEFGQGGALNDVLDCIDRHGAVPQEVYSGLEYGTDRNVHGEMEAIIKGGLDAVIANKNKKLTPVWEEAIASILDVYLGDDPKDFKYKGKKYTPRSFADEVVGLKREDYIAVSSFTYAPFYTMMELEIPDNWSWEKVHNVKMEEMVEIVDNALKNGYTVDWGADVSEKGFSWKNGVVYVPAIPYKEMSDKEKADMFKGPKPELEITQEMREEAYDNYLTTDDHGMHITGLAKDQNGKEYYIVKNSWGDKNDQKGFLYVTKNYFMYKTIDFMVHKDGIPSKMKRKMNID